jgi:hypothetical protein
LKAAAILTLIIGAGCHSGPRLVPSNCSGTTFCELGLRVAYVEVHDVIRPQIGYPKRFSSDECKTNGWVCTTSNDSYDYVYVEQLEKPVFIDTTAHREGYLVALNRLQVAVIPKENYPSFRRSLEYGKLVIEEKWINTGVKRR